MLLALTLLPLSFPSSRARGILSSVEPILRISTPTFSEHRGNPGGGHRPISRFQGELKKNARLVSSVVRGVVMYRRRKRGGGSRNARIFGARTRLPGGENGLFGVIDGRGAVATRDVEGETVHRIVGAASRRARWPFRGRMPPPLGVELQAVMGYLVYVSLLCSLRVEGQ